jgi:carboxypeptidase Taq
MKEALERLRERDREIELISHSIELLEWDQETYMPEMAVNERAEQLSLLKGLRHERMTSPEIGVILEQLRGSPFEPNEQGDYLRAYVREHLRRFERNVKLPKALIERLAKQTALTQAGWIAAKNQSDFPLFAPHLKVLIEIVKEKAHCLGYEESPYDPLLDEYEPWTKATEIEELFSALQGFLQSFVSEIRESPAHINAAFLMRDYPLASQTELSHLILRRIGYDFRGGRLDTSAHPRTSTLGSSDIRITTKFVRQYLPSGIFGTIHEAGHGVYEQGFDTKLAGTLLANGASLGIHESQSRLWENMIGRSLPFWKFFFPRLKEFFPTSLSDVDLTDFYRAVNKVEPSLIRVEADEVTYSLHVMLRFDLEVRLLEGGIEVDDLPQAWREESRNYLGIEPKDDSEGVLQDVHWSLGAIGYFPSYCLGNLYAAQFFNTMQEALPGIEGRIERGDFTPVLSWLREKIHRFGGIYPAGELCRRVTGMPLDSQFFSRYLKEKYAPIYDL